MIFLLASFVFVLGTIIGSFLNVVAFRYNTGMTLGGRSQCFSCSRTLQWFELVPVVSFVALRGKCVDCESKISWQYPLVEVFTGALFLGVFFKFSFLELGIELLVSLLFSLVITSILMVIMVYDMRHKIIPDGLVYAFIILSLLKLVGETGIPAIFEAPHVLDLLAGPLLYMPFFLLWFFSKGTWMGLGDAKLALGIGWMLGFSGGISAVTLAFWMGALFSIASLLMQKFAITQGSLSMKTELPFAPFLILGLLAVYFWNIDVLGLEALASQFSF